MRYFVDLVVRFVPRGTVVLTATTFLSYAMGLLRDRIFAQTFGASTDLDAYNAAFLIPDFAFNVLVASGIAAAAVPLFTELNRRRQREAFAYLNGLLTAAVVVMALTGVAIALLAPQLARLVAPGLPPDGQALVVQLMRIVAFSPILFAASNALGAMLVAQRRFVFYGLSPVFYNAGIIGGALLLAPRFGIMGVAYGTLAGGLLHLLVRFLDSVRSGWRPTVRWEMPTGFFTRTVRLMAPKMVGHPVELVTFWVFTSLASLLAPGSIAVLNFARNFQSVPVSLLGIAMATAVFPSLSEAALGSGKRFRQLFMETAGTIVLVSVAAALVTFLIRQPLVAILLGGGAFDEAAVTLTATVLGFFTLAIPTESLNHLLARSFYAVQNTVIPVAFSVVSLLVAGGSAYLLLNRFGIIALPLGFFAGSLTKTVGLFVIFQLRQR